MRARTKRRLVRLSACVLISLVLAGLTALFSSVERLGRFEGTASDLGFPRGDVDESTLVVAIDASALKAAQRPWPWPRTVHADLVRKLADAGARAIVFDVAFVDSQNGDDELAAAIRAAGNVVLTTTAATIESDTETPESSGLRQADILRPTPTLADAAQAVGSPVITIDGTDGVVREVPLVVEDLDRRLVPSLTLAAIAVAADQRVDPIIRRPTGVQIADRGVPTNQSHELRVSYARGLVDRADPSDAIVSAADVLTGRLDPSRVADKVVFIGATDVSLGDRVQTPVAKGSGMPGVLVHANAYNTMATRNYLSLASTLETTLWVLLVVLVITLAVQFLPAWLAAVVAAGLFVVYLFAAYLRVDAGTIMNLTFPTLAVAFAVPLSGGVRYLVETRQKRRVDALFSQYVPASVAAQLIDEGRVDRVAEGARLDVTAVFVDLRGFTELSADLEPVEVNRMLSDFYEYSSGIVLEHGGTLMTYIGDEVFVIFGAPIPSDDHAATAVECARSLQERVDELDASLAQHGFAPLRFGIGMNAGEAVVSHVGSRWRRQYTAIGDTVNVASRLCSQAGPGQVVLAESVRARAVPPPEVTPIGPLTMKGVRGDFQAWKLVLDRPPSGTRDR